MGDRPRHVESWVIADVRSTEATEPIHEETDHEQCITGWDDDSLNKLNIAICYGQESNPRDELVSPAIVRIGSWPEIEGLPGVRCVYELESAVPSLPF